MPGATLVGAGTLPTRVARRLLHRLLWPYLVERQAFDAAIADALRAQTIARPWIDHAGDRTHSYPHRGSPSNGSRHESDEALHDVA
jgi:hypothetical protein